MDDPKAVADFYLATGRLLAGRILLREPNHHFMRLDIMIL